MGNKRIRICHISEASSGGVLTHLIQLSNYLDSSKFDQSFVLSSIKNSSLKEFASFYNNRLYIIDMKREINFWEDFKSLIKLYKFFKDHKFDIIHCHSSKAGVLGRLAAKISGTKSIYTPHAFSFTSKNAPWKNFVFATIERIMSYLTSVIVCVSEGELQEAIRWRISNQNMIVIKNGIAIAGEESPGQSKESWLKSRGFKGSEVIIGFSGRLSKQKNPEMLLKACRNLKYDNYIIVFLGDGELKAELEELAEAFNIKNKIIFLGEVNNVLEHLSYFNVFVSTSLWEAMPYSILEAIVSKVLVIATNISGVNELIIDGETGVLVPMNDDARLSQVLDEYMSNACKDKYIRIVDAAWEKVKNHYSIEEMITELSKVYIDTRGS